MFTHRYIYVTFNRPFQMHAYFRQLPADAKGFVYEEQTYTLSNTYVFRAHTHTAQECAPILNKTVRGYRYYIT